MNNFCRKYVKILSLLKLIEDFEYRGEHSAPNKESGNPLHDVSESVYPKDFYTLDLNTAIRHYGDGTPEDSESINIVRHYYNKPNKTIRVYRAIPKELDSDEENISELQQLLSHYNKFKFFPVNNEIINDLEPEFEHLPHDEMKHAIYDKIVQIISDKQNNQTKISINVGDWITINKQYAINHGKDHLNDKYKIISKVVKAKEIFTDGDSIHEWGYSP